MQRRVHISIATKLGERRFHTKSQQKTQEIITSTTKRLIGHDTPTTPARLPNIHHRSSRLRGILPPRSRRSLAMSAQTRRLQPLSPTPLLIFIIFYTWLPSQATPPHVTYKAAVGLLFTHEPHAILHADGNIDLHFMLDMPPLQELAQSIYSDENIAMECNLNGTGQNLCLYIKNITRLELKQ